MSAIRNIALIAAVFSAAIFGAGCTTTLREQKVTPDGTGNVTQLKVEPQKVKVTHSF